MKNIYIIAMAMLFLMIPMQNVLGAPITNSVQLDDYYSGIKDMKGLAICEDKIDLLVVAAHPDDEMIYFGGTLPYYAGVYKKKTLTVYMSNQNENRKTEAINGLKVVGNTTYPIFAGFPDKLTKTLSDAKKLWKEEEVIAFMVNVIRKYKPDVVVTHDINGEYGHGAHMLTASAMQIAVEKANDPDYMIESVEKYGVFEIGKLYLHLYKENKITMDWNIPLLDFGGKTALDMAKLGYGEHKTQHQYGFVVTDIGKYSNAEFGLAYNSVTDNMDFPDFFEGIDACEAEPLEIPENIQTITPVATPTKTTKPTQTPPQNPGEPRETNSTQTNSANPDLSVLIIGIVVAVLLIIALVILIKHNRRSKH